MAARRRSRSSASTSPTQRAANPSLAKALIRAFVFVISVYFFYGIPLLYAFFHPQRRGLHDLAADTYVVER